ncbi:LysR family transcriptional regulator [Kribbella sp. NPDC056861]|uniref:LysR family transcriptional regulator n=1 Tax=Kribbella sp. NPDC056861 TaxID=3154857 RepID=UPI003427B228
MNLDLLRTFLAVHRVGSLTRAAAHLGLSQPTVTVQVRTLEEKLGKQLFVRRAGGVTPTGVADELAGQLGRHLDALDEVVDRLLVTDSGNQTLQFGGPPDLTTAKVIPALAGLIERGLRVRTSFGPPDQLIEGLVAGRHDLVVSTARPRQGGLTVEPFFEEEFVLVAGACWAAQLPDDVTAEGGAALDQLPLVSIGEGLPIVGRYWTTAFNRQPRMRPAVVVPDLHAALAAVTAGAGVSVLPTYLVADAIRSEQLVRLYDPVIPPRNMLYLVNRTGPCQPQVKVAWRHLMTEAKFW